MPKVPTVGLNASPLPGFQAPGVTAFRSAVPQQIQQSGKAMEGLGKAVTEVAFKIENDIHDANTIEATNQAELATSRLAQQQENLKGKEAIDAKQGVMDEFNATMSGIADGLHPIARRQFNKAQARLQNRFTLRVEAHHAKASAEHKQQQLLAQEVVLTDNLVNNDLTISVQTGAGPLATSAVSPEALSNFSRYLVNATTQGEDLGYSGKALEVFVRGKVDKLLGSVVTSKLDSEDPAQIQSVEALMANLPEGLISKTQQTNLGKLVETKTRESFAIQWSASQVQADIPYADSLQGILEIAKTDPKKAEAMMGKLNTFTQAKEKAEKEKRGDLMLELSNKIKQGPLTAEDTNRASEAGILDELRLVENRLDVTDDYGERILNELNRKPSAIIARYGDDEGTVARMVDDLKAHVSLEKLLSLTGQYNAFKDGQTGGRTGSGGGKKDKYSLYTASSTNVTDVALLEQDALANKDSKTLDDKLNTKYGEGQSSTRTLSRKTMMDRFHIEVVKRANIKWKTLTDRERENTDEATFLQEVSREVYDSGWVDQEHTRNIYTTEFRYGKPGEDLDALARPMRRDELEPFQKQAQDELIQEERGRAVQQVFDQYIPGNLVLNRQELENQASKDILGIKGMTIRGLADIEAARDRAKNTISPADIDDRAEALLLKEAKKQKQTNGQRQSVVRRNIARSLLTQKIQSIKLPMTTYAKGATDYRGFSASGPSGSITITSGQRIEMFLDQLGDLETQWGESGMNPDDFENFALMFYPGSKNDLPKSVRASLSNIPRSTDDPNGGQLSRLQALKQWFEKN